MHNKSWNWKYGGAFRRIKKLRLLQKPLTISDMLPVKY